MIDVERLTKELAQLESVDRRSAIREELQMLSIRRTELLNALFRVECDISDGLTDIDILNGKIEE